MRVERFLDNIDYVREKLSRPDQVAQLAEEASELCHAALKLERVLRGTNPTPVLEGDALLKVVDKTADVMNVLEVLGIEESYRARIVLEQFEKMDRWVERIKEREAKV